MASVNPLNMIEKKLPIPLSKLFPRQNIPVSQISPQSPPGLIQQRCKGTDFISLDITASRTKAHKSDEELNFMMAVDYAISTFCHTWSIIPRLVQTWTIEKLIPQLDILPSFSIFTLATPQPPLPAPPTPVYLMRELRTFFRCYSHPPFQSIRFLFTTRLTYGGILCVRLPICVKSLGAHTRSSVNFKNCVFLSR